MCRCETWRTITGRGFAATLLALPVFVNAVPPPADPVFELIGTYTTGLADPGEELTSGEVAALKGDKLFVSNASDISVDIVDVSDPTTPTLLQRIDLSAFGTEVTSVAVGNGLVAATVEAGTSPGTLVVFSPGGANLHAVQVGAGPDMVAFTPDGRRMLVANEGEPSGYEPGDTDPPGSISVVDVGPANTLVVHTIDFTAFNPGGTRASELPTGVRIFGSSLPSLDLEPEYITVSKDGQTAWVSLQENNAIAVLNLTTLKVTRIDALGYKDHSVAGSGLDTSDQDGGIIIQPWPKIFGMYQPDALAAFRVGNTNYVLSANEGTHATTTALSRQPGCGPPRRMRRSAQLVPTTRPAGST
jgi:choice-of-anchor I-like protein